MAGGDKFLCEMTEYYAAWSWHDAMKRQVHIKLRHDNEKSNAAAKNSYGLPLEDAVPFMIPPESIRVESKIMQKTRFLSSYSKFIQKI